MGMFGSWLGSLTERRSGEECGHCEQGRRARTATRSHTSFFVFCDPTEPRTIPRRWGQRTSEQVEHDWLSLRSFVSNYFLAMSTKSVIAHWALVVSHGLVSSQAHSKSPEMELAQFNLIRRVKMAKPTLKEARTTRSCRGIRAR